MPTVDHATKKRAIPKAKDTEPTGLPNFADKEEAAEKTLERVAHYFEYFKSQPQRCEYEESIEKADQMFRMAQGQTKAAENLTRASQDTVPHLFFTLTRMISAWETDILLPPKDLPGKYIPMENGDDVQKQQARQVCEDRSMLYEYSMTADDRRRKLATGWWSVNKYANGLFTKTWYSCEKEVRRRVVKSRDENGEPTKISWQTKTEKIAYPVLRCWDWKDAYMDSNIEDVQQQQCLVFRSYPVQSELRSMQANGFYKNFKDVGEMQLYNGQVHNDILEKRQEHATGTSDVTTATGQYDQFDAFVRLPIDDKGMWDPDSQPARWFWVTFVGDVTQGKDKAICMRLTPEPFPEKDEIPVYLAHSHRDDNGPFHMGYKNVMEPINDEYKTMKDQWYDLKDQKCNSPWLVEEGALINDNKDFHPRRQWNMRRGGIGRIQKLPIDIHTNDFMAFMDKTEAIAREVMGVTRAFEGAPMGGRTSAQEAKNSLDQSMKPALDKLRYMAGLIEWDAKTDAQFWEHYADKDLTVTLLRGEMSHEIKPSNLWGRYTYKLIAVDEYETNTIQRQEFDRFFSVYSAAALPTMPMEGQRNFMKDAMKGRPMFDQERYWPPDMAEDARKRSQEENMGMMPLDGSEGVWTEPQQGENHDLHLDNHRNYIAIYRLLPDANKENLKMAEQHNLMTEQLKKQQQQSIQAGAQQGANTLQNQADATNAQPASEATPGLGLSDTPPLTGAEATTDLLAAEEGGLALQ